jgi:NAD(P)-dependent dehydrogenase (short-subunit alcohol dehydrogenase family)
MKVAQRCKELGGKVNALLLACSVSLTACLSPGRQFMRCVQAHVVAGDLGSQAHVQVLVDQAVQEMGGIDVLILNHVVGYWDNWLLGNASDMEETLQHYFRINTFGSV